MALKTCVFIEKLRNRSCQSQVLYKIAALKNLIKVFFCKFYKSFQNSFITEHLQTTSSEFRVQYEDLQGRYRLYVHRKIGSRKIALEQNCPLALILTLILNQTRTLTWGQFSSGAIFRTPKKHMTLKSLFDSLLLKGMVALQTN